MDIDKLLTRRHDEAGGLFSRRTTAAQSGEKAIWAAR